ncbi:hypothetical protein ZWY2020_025258 [Hordeum vulgare]|nr:hypothetical protein ZWY2020_025258 [Hordeum vulgare]
MYQQNFLDNSVNHPNQDRLLDYKIFFYSEFYSQILSEGFAIVVEIPFCHGIILSERKEIPKFQNLRSIHSIFPFRRQILHLDYLSHIEIPYPIHLEIWFNSFNTVSKMFHLCIYYDSFNYYSNWNSFITSMKSILFSKRK